MFFKKSPTRFVDRGDCNVYDKVLANFTCDGDWHDLDLSAIVPAGAKAIQIYLFVKGSAANAVMQLRKKGNVNPYNASVTCVQVVDVYLYNECIVFCNDARSIQYLVAPSYTAIYMVVKGWFT